MNRKSSIATVGMAIVFWPVSAFADAGTPLVLGSAFHLFLGNALLGLLEGWLLARVFQLPRRRCVRLLILANYLSAWIGMMLMSYLFHEYATDIYSGLAVTWMLIAASYLLTLIVEWPFVALSFRKTPHWFQKDPCRYSWWENCTDQEGVRHAGIPEGPNHRTSQSSERGPAVAHRDKSNVIGG